VEGHDQKKFSGALRWIGIPTFAPDWWPPHSNSFRRHGLYAEGLFSIVDLPCATSYRSKTKVTVIFGEKIPRTLCGHSVRRLVNRTTHQRFWRILRWVPRIIACASTRWRKQRH